MSASLSSGVAESPRVTSAPRVADTCSLKSSGSSTGSSGCSLRPVRCLLEPSHWTTLRQLPARPGRHQSRRRRSSPRRHCHPPGPPRRRSRQARPALPEYRDWHCRLPDRNTVSGRWQPLAPERLATCVASAGGASAGCASAGGASAGGASSTAGSVVSAVSTASTASWNCDASGAGASAAGCASSTGCPSTARRPPDPLARARALSSRPLFRRPVPTRAPSATRRAGHSSVQTCALPPPRPVSLSLPDFPATQLLSRGVVPLVGISLASSDARRGKPVSPPMVPCARERCTIGDETAPWPGSPSIVT